VLLPPAVRYEKAAKKRAHGQAGKVYVTGGRRVARRR